MSIQPTSPEELKESLDRGKVIARTGFIGIIVNLLLAGFKAAVGVISGSIAIVLDSVNNLSDAGSSLITIIGAKLGAKQPDKKHPWGHGRVEYLSAMVIALIIMYAGITSLTESIKKMIDPTTPNYTLPTLIIVGVAVPVKILLGRYVKKKGEQVESESLVNSGMDAMMDAVISSATLAAAIVFLLSGLKLEAWLGAVISIIIIKSGFEMLQGGISEVLGQRIDPETIRKVAKTVNSFPQVQGSYDLIFHDYGPGRVNGSLHIEVEDTLTASDIDTLTRAITMAVFEETGVILTAVGIYSINTGLPELVEMRMKAARIALAHEHVIQVHGFYLHQEEKLIQMDIVIDFEAEDRQALYLTVVEELRNAFPGYTVMAALDNDFSLTE